jgi:hypothetical protein
MKLVLFILKCAIMPQDYPSGNPQISYHIPPLKTVLLWHRAEAPRNLLLSQPCHRFYCVSHLRHPNSYYNSLSYSILPLPPRNHLWTCLTPSSDIIIIVTCWWYSSLKWWLNLLAVSYTLTLNHTYIEAVQRYRSVTPFTDHHFPHTRTSLSILDVSQQWLSTHNL